MRSSSISVVKNEADVIEAMVRHNAMFLDHMIVVDNGSTDGTLQILQALCDEGLPIHLLQNSSAGHMQTSIVNELVNSPICDRSGHVFFLDADEFICCDLAEFQRALEASPESFTLQWKTYVPVATELGENLGILEQMSHCRKREPLGKTSFKVVLGPDQMGQVTLGSGNHFIKGLTLSQHDSIRLGHFPVRSAEQLACKVLLGSWNIQLRGRGKTEAAQWFEIADYIRKNGLPSAARLQDLAAGYAAPRAIKLRRDPLKSPEPVILRYDNLARNPLLNGLIGFTDSLVAQLAVDS